ncbi:MAG: adenylate/guanylate cyclase domain-containing protein [Anaeromyxobacteraceae bacterium]
MFEAASCAVWGLSDPVADHTIRASHLALELIEAVDHFNEHSRYKVRVRIGLDTGGGVAGVAGRLEAAQGLPSLRVP